MVEKGRTFRQSSGQASRNGVVEIVLVIAVLVVVALGYFVWRNVGSGNVQGPSTGGQTDLQASDEVSQIEQDIEMVETSSINADLSSIEAEINTALSK